MADELMTNPGPTDEEIAAAEAHAEKMAPLVALVASDAFAEVSDALQSMHTAYITDQIGYSHLYAVMSTMPRLKAWAESQ